MITIQSIPAAEAAPTGVQPSSGIRRRQGSSFVLITEPALV